ncbi:hypothetical protein RJ641_036913 [Dillenia turbinata]|uniref:65-kDa microtubule-associated protein 5 n=1 Tax=Dillenia turbinata TaxID=194707 RepID=A0AAN8ZBD2_9MAGN
MFTSTLAYRSPTRTTTTCASLFQELQKLWDEIGECESERDQMLVQLEQECLDIYRRRVEQSRKHKADLHKALLDAEAEAAYLISALGDLTSFSRVKGTLKEQTRAINLVLEKLRIKKQERVKQFSDVLSSISVISVEISGASPSKNRGDPLGNANDLTLKKLEELRAHLQELQAEKNLRLQKVNSYLNSIHELCAVMSIDVNQKVSDVHPSLVCTPKSFSNDTLAKLLGTIQSLKQEKESRLQKIKDLAGALVKLWNLLETPLDEQKRFDHVISLVPFSVHEVFGQGVLSSSAVNQAEIEVERLNVLRSRKLKELVMSKLNQLEEIYKGVHMEVDSDMARQIFINLDSGNIDLSDLLSGMDDEIQKAKEQAFSRADILEKVEKWRHASQEENWLDEYERDGNRYSAGRGAHKSLKRAEKARVLVGKLPALVENLIAKVKVWELEKGIPFLYNKASLLHMLEEYIVQQQQKEEEKRKSREQKRIQEQRATEREALFGSKPAIKKPLGQSTAANSMTGTPNGHRVAPPSARHGVSSGKERKDSGRAGTVIPYNYVALSKDDDTAPRDTNNTCGMRLKF